MAAQKHLYKSLKKLNNKKIKSFIKICLFLNLAVFSISNIMLQKMLNFSFIANDRELKFCICLVHTLPMLSIKVLCWHQLAQKIGIIRCVPLSHFLSISLVLCMTCLNLIFLKIICKKNLYFGFFLNKQYLTYVCNKKIKQKTYSFHFYDGLKYFQNSQFKGSIREKMCTQNASSLRGHYACIRGRRQKTKALSQSLGCPL